MGALTFLPLDLSGTQLSNRITNEPVSLIALPNRTDRVIMLRHGGFYTEQLTIFRPDGSTLKRGVDWIPTYLYQGLTELTTQEVYGMIVIKNPLVPAALKVSYRAVGGLFGVPVDELKAIMLATQDDQFTFTWESIIAKPSEFNAEEHLHKFWQVYGWTSTNIELDRIRKAITTGDDAIVADAKEYALLLLTDSKTRLKGYDTAFEAHYADMADPHVTTKLQIGLPDMNNWGMATKQESLDGVGNKYTNPTRVYQQLAAVAIPSLNAHVLDTNNPHKDTAALIGAYTEIQINTRWQSRLPRDATTYDSALLQGLNYAQFYNSVHDNLPAGNVTTGQFATTRLGYNPGDWQRLLVGNYWRPIADIFAAYDQTKSATFYIGGQASEAAGAAWLNAVYTDLNQFPVGTYAIGRVPLRLWNGNIIYQSTLFQRTSGGWGAF